jgi:hypothetical protein
MAYVFGDELVVDGDLDQIWDVWTDLASFPRWDPREERTEPRGPFAVGTTVWSKQRGNPGGESTITGIEPRRRWTAESPLPGGRLVIEHVVEPVGPGRVKVAKHYEAHGPLVALFRLYYGPRVRRALPETFRALQREAARRAGGGSPADDRNP